jgi:hypothetical protein
MITPEVDCGPGRSGPLLYLRQSGVPLSSAQVRIFGLRAQHYDMEAALRLGAHQAGL